MTKYAGEPSKPVFAASNLPSPASYKGKEVLFDNSDGTRSLLYSDGSQWLSSAGLASGAGLIADNLTTISSTTALSANQGVVLNGYVNAKATLQTGPLASNTNVAPNADAVVTALAAKMNNTLVGLGTSSPTVILSTDTTLVALQKLQAQISQISGSGDTTSPTLVSAVVQNAAPAVVELTFNEALNQSQSPTGWASAFSIPGKTITTTAWGGLSTKLNVTVSVAFSAGATGTISFAQTGTVNLQDAAGNKVQSFNNQTITNNVAGGTDTRPRFGTGAANAYSASPQSLIDSMTPLTGSSNNGAVGTFSLTTTSGNYGWLAVISSVTTSGVHVYDGIGYGGWSGAGSAGNFTGGPLDPSTSSVTFTDSSSRTWRLFRQDYVNANPTAGSYTLSPNP